MNEEKALYEKVTAELRSIRNVFIEVNVDRAPTSISVIKFICKFKKLSRVKVMKGPFGITLIEL